MIPVLFALDMMQATIGILMFLSSLFLILLVLVQRGRGGGLAGALGGMGGQSAFGTKAGDTFTKLTIVVASVWIILCMASVVILGNRADHIGGAATGGPNPGGSMTQEAGLPGSDVDPLGQTDNQTRGAGQLDGDGTVGSESAGQESGSDPLNAEDG